MIELTEYLYLYELVEQNGAMFRVFWFTISRHFWSQDVLQPLHLYDV